MNERGRLINCWKEQRIHQANILKEVNEWVFQHHAWIDAWIAYRPKISLFIFINVLISNNGRFLELDYYSVAN